MPTGERTSINNQVSAYYTRWKTQYLADFSFTSADGSGTGYVLEAETNPSVVEGLGETISQSEAHGWAMIATVLMAGNDASAKEIFDGYYTVYRSWPSSDHPDLMSWAVPKDGNLSAERRLPSATDGDMDVAYSLLLAHEQWGGKPEGFELSYLDAAIRVIKALEENNILYAPESAPDAAFFPRLGIGNNDPAEGYWEVRATRSSDFMLSHFHAFHNVRKFDSLYVKGEQNGLANVWHELEANTIAIVEHMQNPQTGLMPDFMGNQNGAFSQDISTFKGISDEPYENPGQNDDTYWYNACRFPWRFAQSYMHDTIPEAKAAIETINAWLTSTDTHKEWEWYNDSLIKSGYHLGGWALEGADYYDKAFASPFMTAMALSEDSWNFNDMWNGVSTFTEPDDWSTHYYDNTITLLSILLVSGNWWKPTPLTDIVPVVQTVAGMQSQGLSLNKGMVSGLAPLEPVTIYTLDGRELRVMTANRVGSLTLPSLPSGIYVLQSLQQAMKIQY